MSKDDSVVYIVQSAIDDNGWLIEGVFSTRELADAYATKLKDKYEYCIVSIKMWRLDNETM